jgi:hypothetical protein
MTALPQKRTLPRDNIAASDRPSLRQSLGLSNATLFNNNPGSANIDALMAEFDAIVLALTNPWSARPSVFVI